MFLLLASKSDTFPQDEERDTELLRRCIEQFNRATIYFDLDAFKAYMAQKDYQRNGKVAKPIVSVNWEMMKFTFSNQQRHDFSACTTREERQAPYIANRFALWP